MILNVLKKYLGKLVSDVGSSILQFVEVEVLNLLVAVGKKAADELKMHGDPVVAGVVAVVNDKAAEKVVGFVDNISKRDDEWKSI